jgi:hypothetical protein
MVDLYEVSAIVAARYSFFFMSSLNRLPSQNILAHVSGRHALKTSVESGGIEFLCRQNDSVS